METEALAGRNVVNLLLQDLGAAWSQSTGDGWAVAASRDREQ